MEDINENTRNLYIIRRRLAERERRPGLNYWDYYIGDFVVKIHPDRIQEHAPIVKGDRITNYAVLDVNLYEMSWDSGRTHKYEQFVNLEQDSRFKNYQPIKYKEYAGLSSGAEMPITHLCELIKYLHRLSNLTAFL
jgi:hypothetical protein